MTVREQRGSTLSVYRAFVVHLADAPSKRRRFSGRVEHLSSGESVHFTSLKQLLVFLARHARVAGKRSAG